MYIHIQAVYYWLLTSIYIYIHIYFYVYKFIYMYIFILTVTLLQLRMVKVARVKQSPPNKPWDTWRFTAQRLWTLVLDLTGLIDMYTVFVYIYINNYKNNNNSNNNNNVLIIYHYYLLIRNIYIYICRIPSSVDIEKLITAINPLTESFG